MDVGLSRIELRGLLKLGDCRGQLILEFECEAEVVMQRGIVGDRAKSFLKFSYGCVEVGTLQVCDPQISAISAVARLEPQRCLELNDGARSVSYLDEGEAQIVVGIGVFGLAGYDLAKRCNCPHHVALSLEG